MILYPLISIRIPLYNHSKFIAKTLDSIKDDCYPNKEIIIIDDGSTDNSRVVVRRWINLNPNIKVIFQSRKNLGIPKTLNELHSMCNGEYIVGIASDDYLINNSINIRYEWLKSHPNKKVLFTDSEIINEKDKLLYTSSIVGRSNVNIENYKDDKLLRKEIISQWAVVGGTLMYHKSIIEEYKYDSSSQIEDYDFYLFCVSKNYLGFENICSSRYRLHDNNFSRDKENYYIRQFDMIKALKKYFKFFSWKEKLYIINRIFWIIRKVIKKYLREKVFMY